MSQAPSINVFGSGPHSHHNGASARAVLISHHSISPNMPIPNSRQAPPPPLPPPRDLASFSEDLGWKYGNRTPTSPRAPVKPGSSLLGSGQPNKEYTGAWSPPYNQQHNSRRSSTISTVAPKDPMIMDGLDHSDEDRGLGKRPSLSSESQLGRKEVHTASQAYDKHLLSRIGGPNAGATSNHNKFAGQLKPLSVPDHRYPTLESPLSRWASAPSSGLSPGGGFRSPYLEQTSIDSAFPSRVNSVSTPDAFDDNASSYRSHRNSDDQGVFLDPELTKMDGLDIHDRSSHVMEGDQLGIAGIKRRASSPPSEEGPTREERASQGSANDLYHRRSMQMLAQKASPLVTRSTAQYGASLSSTASAGPKAGSSFASTWNMSNASSLTSYNGERLSPTALSPSAADADFGANSPYAASRTLIRSPRSSASKAAPHQNRKLSDPTLDSKMQSPTVNDVHSRQSSVSKPPKPKAWEGYPHVCECCPKKPKKFDTAEELRMHQAEKQYQCSYCPNRFKNKNEAERHQNSLHLRKYSWSCAALGGVSAAFHPSHIHPTTCDVCGYCGEEFPNPPNWDVRAEHLCQQHKFGECNQAKKFFRADHFRQHLKHSHAGTSGKWTNMLENACQKEEAAPPPMPPRNVMAPTAPMMYSPESPYPMQTGYHPGVINEVQDEQ